MPNAHAVVLIDHHHATVQKLTADAVATEKVQDHHHYTRQHKSGVRSVHEFFGEVCDALQGVGEILITGSHTALADFRHYVDKHRPALKPHMAGWEAVDHPSEAQLTAMGRKFFAAYDRMHGAPPTG